MASLRSVFLPLLLTGASALTACGDKSPRDDLSGMTDSIAEACLVENKTDKSKMSCASLGKEHALTLVKYADAGDQFKKACSFRELGAGVPEFAKAMITGAEVSRCLSYVGKVAKDPEVKRVANQINNTVRAGIL